MNERGIDMSKVDGIFDGNSIVSEVRGGGIVGTGAWVARLTGIDEEVDFARDFIRGERRLSGSGRSGRISFELGEPGIYEYRKVGSDGFSIGYQKHSGGIAGYFEYHADGTVEDLDKREARRRVISGMARARAEAAAPIDREMVAQERLDRVAGGAVVRIHARVEEGPDFVAFSVTAVFARSAGIERVDDAYAVIDRKTGQAAIFDTARKAQSRIRALRERITADDVEAIVGLA
jgi:hypothetical protein